MASRSLFANGKEALGLATVARGTLSALSSMPKLPMMAACALLESVVFSGTHFQCVQYDTR